jgi:hypothetical protein
MRLTAVTVTAVMPVTVMMMVMTVMVMTVMVMTSGRAMTVSVMSDGPGRGRASKESSRCQAHRYPESSHWLAPWCCGSVPRSTWPDRILDVDLIASAPEPAAPTASGHHRGATGTRCCTA